MDEHLSEGGMTSYLDNEVEDEAVMSIHETNDTDNTIICPLATTKSLVII